MRISIAAAILILLPAAAFAGGYAVPNTNARDEGMAGAAVADQTGPEAAFGNSAALAGQEGLGISASGTLISFRSTWTDTTGGTGAAATTSMVPKAAFPPNLNITYGSKVAGMPFGVGLNFAVPGGGLVFWPEGWAGKAQIIQVDRRVQQFELSGGIQVIEQVKLGLGLVYFYTTEKLAQVLPFGTQDGRAELATSGGKVSFTAAFEARPIKDLPLRIAVQYRHKADMHLEGKAHFSNIPDAFRTSGLIDQNVTHDLTFPNVTHVGASYDVLPNLTLNLAVSFWRYIVYKQDIFAGDKGTTVIVPRNYTNGQTYRIGGEFGVIPQLKVRLGFLRDVTPQPTETLSPTLPESSRWAVSGGLGFDITPNLSANASTEFAIFDTATTTGPTAFPGQYDTKANVFSVGLVYRMR